MPRVDSHGVSIYYESHGEGPAIVFAHGAGGNHLSWWQQVPEFSRAHRVITFDHRGFGQSHCSPEQFDPALFADDLFAILEACGVDRLHGLVCQSMGGWTGLPAALRSPERIHRLVLCGTPGGVVTQKVLDQHREIAARIGREGVISSAAVSPDFPELEPALTFLYDQISGLNPGVDPEVAGAVLRTRVEPEALQRHSVPTLLIAGEYDVLFPPEVIHDVAKQIPGSRVHDFKGVGHSSYFEDPEHFNRVVGEFLAA